MTDDEGLLLGYSTIAVPLIAQVSHLQESAK